VKEILLSLKEITSLLWWNGNATKQRHQQKAHKAGKRNVDVHENVCLIKESAFHLLLAF